MKKKYKCRSGNDKTDGILQRILQIINENLTQIKKKKILSEFGSYHRLRKLEENKSLDWENEQTGVICLNWPNQRIQVHENNIIKIFGVRNMTLRSTNYETSTTNNQNC